MTEYSAGHNEPLTVELSGPDAPMERRDFLFLVGGLVALVLVAVIVVVLWELVG